MNTQLARTTLPKRVSSTAVSFTPQRRNIIAKSEANAQLVICVSTALSFALGRFVVRPLGIYKETQLYQTGNAYPKEEQFFKSLAISNDPVGFSIGDVAAYGALGHILGYGALASIELQEVFAQGEGAVQVMPFLQLLQGVPFDKVTSTIDAKGL